MSSASNSGRHRNHRPVYSGPGRNVLGPNDIGMALVPTRHALELALALAVLLVDVPTRNARSGGVPWVHNRDPHSRLQRLVRDHLPQLKEPPSHVSRTLTPPNRGPFVDALEVLQCDTTAGALGLADDCLADAVVLDLPEAGLLAREFLEVALGRLGAGALKPVPETVVALPNGLDLGAGVVVAVAVGGEVTDAEVHAKPAVRVDGAAVGYVYRDVQEELALAVHEVGLATHAFDASAMVGAHDDGGDDSLAKRSEGNPVETVLEGVESLVVGDSAIWAETRLFGLVALEGFADLGDGPDGELGVETEGGADLGVVEFLEFELVGGTKGEGPFGEPSARFVEPLHEAKERGLLLIRDDDLARGDQLHYHRRTMSMQTRQHIPLLPGVNAGASVSPYHFTSDGVR